MEIINLFLFFSCLVVCRKNLFVFIFYTLTFVFCYSRYIVSWLNDSYVLGGEEWVFIGVSDSTIQEYPYLFLLFQCICFFIFISSKKQNKLQHEIKNRVVCYILLYALVFFLVYKAYILISVIYSQGYLAAVDYRVPTWLAIVTSSVSKPFILMLLLLYGFSSKRSYLFCALFLLVLISVSGQRKDLVSVLLFFFCYFLSESENKYMKLAIALGAIFAVSLGIFWLRESSLSFSNNFIFDMFWGLGISINPGLYVVENYERFDAIDSLGFPVTYFYCGIGKFFSNVCFDSVRLEYPGFLLEKIAYFQNFDSDTVFGGLGGNLIASLVVAAGYEGALDATFIATYLAITFILVFSVVFSLTRLKITVTSALLITNVLISSRYAIDGIFPVINQLIVAIFLDLFVIKNTKPN